MSDEIEVLGQAEPAARLSDETIEYQRGLLADPTFERDFPEQAAMLRRTLTEAVAATGQDRPPEPDLRSAPQRLHHSRWGVELALDGRLTLPRELSVLVARDLDEEPNPEDVAAQLGAADFDPKATIAAAQAVLDRAGSTIKATTLGVHALVQLAVYAGRLAGTRQPARSRNAPRSLPLASNPNPERNNRHDQNPRPHQTRQTPPDDRPQQSRPFAPAQPTGPTTPCPGQGHHVAVEKKMSKTSFDEAAATAHNRHQVAIAEAHATFNATVAVGDRARDARYEAAAAAWEAVKSDVHHPEHDQRREAFDRAKQPADHTAARKALAGTVAEADSALHAELRQIGAEHGVLISTGVG
jgi:hypothetical protein